MIPTIESEELIGWRGLFQIISKVQFLKYNWKNLYSLAL